MHNWLRCLRSGAHLGAISPQPPAGPPQPPAGPPAAPPVPPRGGPRGGWAWVVAMCPLLTSLQDIRVLQAVRRFDEIGRAGHAYQDFM